MFAHSSRYWPNSPRATATSNGPPPVVTSTPAAWAAAIFARDADSFAICQHAIDNFSVAMRWPLWARWLSISLGAYPGSNGDVSAGSSRTPSADRKACVDATSRAMIATSVLVGSSP